MFDGKMLGFCGFAAVLGLGCAAPPKDGGATKPTTTGVSHDAKPDGDVDGGNGDSADQDDGEGETEVALKDVACELIPGVETPSWAAKSDSPRPSRKDFSGSWLPAYDPATYPPGIVKWQRSCYGGHSMLILQQKGQEVTATWSSSSGVSGAMPEFHYSRSEQAVGTRDGDQITLEGQRTDRKTSTMGSRESEISCSPLRYELTFVPKTKRLVGTVNGDPIEFAPAVINDTPRQDCGAPPP